jgi:putative transposase
MSLPHPQYACHEYQKQLYHYEIIASMRRKGDCRGDAPMERFFGSLKLERLSSWRFATCKTVETKILDCITYYNFARLHPTLG